MTLEEQENKLREEVRKEINKAVDRAEETARETVKNKERIRKWINDVPSKDLTDPNK